MNIFLRIANIEDKKLLYEWRNDPICRENSINTDFITYDSHCEWFRSRLNSTECSIFICMKENDPIGQIRVDYEQKIGRISYSVDCNHRGRGYGIKMLELLEQNEAVLHDIIKLEAVVKRNNIASQKCFEKMKYSREDCEGLIYYSKVLKKM